MNYSFWIIKGLFLMMIGFCCGVPLVSEEASTQEDTSNETEKTSEKKDTLSNTLPEGNNIDSHRDVELSNKKKQNELELLQRLRQTFRYGTYQEQIDILQGYLSNRYPKTEAYQSVLHEVVQSDPEHEQVIISLAKVIEKWKLEGHYNYLEMVLNKELSHLIGSQQEKENADENVEMDAMERKSAYRIIEGVLISMIEIYRVQKVEDNGVESLRRIIVMMMDQQDKVYQLFPVSVMILCCRALGMLKVEGYRDRLRAYYTNSENEDIKAAALEGLSQYQHVEDISFYRDIIESPSEGDYFRWLSLVLLGEYSPHDMAKKILIQYADHIDPNMAKRALYALMKFRDSAVRTVVMKAAQNDNATIRLQAIKCLEVFSGKDVLKMLEYKSKYDVVSSIRIEAKRILDLKLKQLEKEKKKTK